MVIISITKANDTKVVRTCESKVCLTGTLINQENHTPELKPNDKTIHTHSNVCVCVHVHVCVCVCVCVCL